MDMVRSSYQDAFVTPGISPRWALLRKQIRQILNFRRNARGRPQRWQRLRPCTLKRGGREDFTRWDVFANSGSPSSP